MKTFCVALFMMMMAIQTPAQESLCQDKDDVTKEVMHVLDLFMTAFNRQDLTAVEDTFHFPHYRLASGRMNVLNSAGEMKKADLKRYLEKIGWHHSSWDRRDIIHLSDNKVHVDTKFTRYREDGSVIGSYESLYILTKVEGKWGVKLRSSFAE